MILLIDNKDSFTYNVLHYLQQAGAACQVLRSEGGSLQAIEALAPAGLVISPGPGRPADHPLIQQLLQRYHSTLPILGICLGHQAIGEYYGCSLVKAPAPVHGKVATINHQGHPMFAGTPQSFQVCRYHSLVLATGQNAALQITSHSQDGLPMSLAHKHFPLWGLQFHPEAILSEYGSQLFKNWLALLP